MVIQSKENLLEMTEFFENQEYFLEDKLRLLFLVFSNLEKLSEPQFDSFTTAIKKTFDKQRTTSFKGKL
jgi:hypothetical protein